MSDRVKWIDYKGRHILFVDLDSLNEEKVYVETMGAFINEISKLNNKKILFGLINMPNLKTSITVNAKGKELMDICNKNKVDAVAAIVGMKSWQKTMANLIKGNRKIEYFDTIEMAKDWLADQQ